jgi:NAD(P)H-dependent flavin oxidoreductase YrpB (nitropropane dioxygenase family)
VTPLARALSLEFPIFAFSHCRDVVAEVSNAGGMGVLGSSMLDAAQLDIDLRWLDSATGGRPYGVDFVVPAARPAERGAAPDGRHQHLIDDILDQFSVPRPHQRATQAFSIGEEIGRELVDVAARHRVALFANGLGVPPGYMFDSARRKGAVVASLAGSSKHAVDQVEAGVDVIVAQGTEAGGHCGEIGTMVLVPEVIDAVRQVRDIPILAAGGIADGRQVAASLALGAQGVWTGSVWLTTHEADTPAYAKSRMLTAGAQDVVRSRSRTGKPSRQLRSAWTTAWDESGLKPMPLPLQSDLVEPVLAHIDALAVSGHPGAQELATYWVGQGVGLMRESRPAAHVVAKLIEQCLEAAEAMALALEPG